MKTVNHLYEGMVIIGIDVTPRSVSFSPSSG